MFANIPFEIDLEGVDDEHEEEEMIIPEDGCCVGDHVVCKTRDGVLVARHERSDAKLTLTVIGRQLIDDGVWEYVAYVPEYESGTVSSCFRIRPQFAENFGIQKKYVGELGLTFRRNNVMRLSYRADGLSCSKCEEFFRMAVGNQEDGTLICYSCKQNPYR